VTTDVFQHRKADHPIEPLILRRWSPRAMSGQPLTDEELLTLFEAGRWAPSTSNEQEWRYVYARHGSKDWPKFFDLLAEGNRVWCHRAAMLVVILAHKVFSRSGKPNPVHLFDTGCSFENIALQGTAMGLVVHGMAGFEYERARTALNVPDDFAVVAMFAAGHPGDPAELPETLQKREVPSDRKPVKEIICEGTFAFGADGGTAVR
jgi:nitroreductase